MCHFLAQTHVLVCMWRESVYIQIHVYVYTYMYVMNVYIYMYIYICKHACVMHVYHIHVCVFIYKNTSFYISCDTPRTHFLKHELKRYFVSVHMDGSPVKNTGSYSKTPGQFAAPTQELIIFCKFNSREPNVLFWPAGYQACTWCTDIHGGKRPIHIT